MDVLILCGGQATRLGSLAANRPKVLMPVNGRPFLEHLLDFYGPWAKHVILLGGHLGEQLRPYESTRVGVVVEPTRLDTGGAVLAVLPRVSERFAVANGDTLFVGLNLGEFFAAAAEAPATAAVLRAATAGRGHIEVEGRRAICFREKEGPSEGWVYAGLCVLSRAQLTDFPRGPVSLERVVLPRLAERGQLHVWPFAGKLFDIGTPEGLDAFAKASPGGITSAHSLRTPLGDEPRE